jgi:UDP-N-acetylglucosamine--N-acetylmuramyl-(pentapeptide) pyrophosphoryl-undecaprenol N-acetylglucosamine transferase
MKLALCGGGTGGHVYPALSIAAALERELNNGASLDTLYLGSRDGAEADIVERMGLTLQPIASGPIRGRNPWQLARNSALMARGVAQARRALAEFAPDAVLSTGGYTSFPIALAARSKGVPIALYLPDVYPGWAVQAIARMARRIAISAPETLRKLSGRNVMVTGYPVRDEFWQVSRPEGRKRLGLDPEEKVLFVAGASQGAHSINRAVAENLRSLLELCEVIHVSGPADEAWLAGLMRDLPANLLPRYHLFGYLNQEFAWAMAAADLALCRAGASVIGELPAAGLPGVLVPYPYAGAHQWLNARHLEENGAAIILDDRGLGSMLSIVGGLLSDSARLDEMGQAARRLARPDAASKIARMILEMNGA